MLKVVFHSYYSNVIGTWLRSAIGVLQGYYMVNTEVLKGCLRGCCKGVKGVLHSCFKYVTGVL